MAQKVNLSHSQPHSSLLAPKEQKITTQLPRNVVLIRIAAASFFTACVVAKAGLTFWSWPVAILGTGFVLRNAYKHLLTNDPLVEAMYQIVGGKEKFNELVVIPLNAKEGTCSVISNFKNQNSPLYRAVTSDGRKILIINTGEYPIALVEKLGPQDFPLNLVPDFDPDNKILPKLVMTGFVFGLGDFINKQFFSDFVNCKASIEEGIIDILHRMFQLADEIIPIVQSFLDKTCSDDETVKKINEKTKPEDSLTTIMKIVLAGIPPELKTVQSQQDLDNLAKKLFPELASKNEPEQAPNGILDDNDITGLVVMLRKALSSSGDQPERDGKLEKIFAIFRERLNAPPTPKEQELDKMIQMHKEMEQKMKAFLPKGFDPEEAMKSLLNQGSRPNNGMANNPMQMMGNLFSQMDSHFGQMSEPNNGNNPLAHQSQKAQKAPSSTELPPQNDTLTDPDDKVLNDALDAFDF